MGACQNTSMFRDISLSSLSDGLRHGRTLELVGKFALKCLHHVVKFLSKYHLIILF